MSRDIIEAIDAAIADESVSLDAARSIPDPVKREAERALVDVDPYHSGHEDPVMPVRVARSGRRYPIALYYYYGRLRDPVISIAALLRNAIT